MGRSPIGGVPGSCEPAAHESPRTRSDVQFDLSTMVDNDARRAIGLPQVELRATHDFHRRLLALADERARARIAVAVKRMEDGNFGDCRGVGGGVMECRIHYGPGYRVYFTVRGRQLVVLLLCGDKATQARDIAWAVQLASRL